MLDDSVEVLGTHAMPLQRARAHRQPRDTALLVDTKTTQHLGEEAYAPRRGRCVDSLVHLLGIDAPRQEIASDRMAARRRVTVPERAGVGENRRIERPRDRRCDLEIELAREIVDELPGRARRRVGQHDIPRRVVGRHVVIDDDLGNR